MGRGRQVLYPAEHRVVQPLWDSDEPTFQEYHHAGIDTSLGKVEVTVLSRDVRSRELNIAPLDNRHK